MTKGTIGFLLANIFIWIAEFKSLFAKASLGLYLYASIIAIAGHAGQTFGRLTDSLVILFTSIIFGGGLGSLTSVIGSPSLVAMSILTFLWFLFFLYFRSFGPRYGGFAIIGCLLVAFAILSSVNAGNAFLPQPFLYYAIVSFLIGSLISLSVNLLIFPTFAHKEYRVYLQAWINELSTFLRLTIKHYTEFDDEHYNRKEAQAVLESLRNRLLSKSTTSSVLLNDVSSEINYSTTPFPVLALLTKKLIDITTDALFMRMSIQNYKDWTEKMNLSSGYSQDFSSKGEALISHAERVLSETSDYLGNQIILDSEQGKESFAFIESVAAFELELRNALNLHYENGRKNGNDKKDWIESTENILTIYHFSLSMEKTMRQILQLRSCFYDQANKKRWYFPFSKWIPFKIFQSIIDTFNLKTYYRNGSFSFLVVAAKFTSFWKANIWTLKSAFAMSLFMIMFLEIASRPFWNTYGLTGGLLTLVIVLNPSMGATYKAALYQVLGSATGNTLGLISFYAFGPNPYLLWIPILLIGYPSYYILIELPQYSSIGLLLPLGFTGSALACWNQQFLPERLKTEYWLIWARSIVSLLIGISFGTAFNLFVFPRFAKHELRVNIADTLVKLEKLYMQEIDIPSKFSDWTEQGFETSRAQVEHLANQITGLISTFSILRMNLELAKIEPELSFNFDAEKYQAVINKMTSIWYALRGAQLSLEEPWYVEISIQNLWKDENLVYNQQKLVQTMQILFSLYESSIVMKRKLNLKDRISAISVRKNVSYKVLCEHLSSSLSKKVRIEVEDDDVWINAKMQLCNDNVCINRKFGVGTLADVYYYSYISCNKLIVQGVDDLWPLIDSLFDKN